VVQDHLDARCHQLKEVVDDAGAGGNEVVKTWTGFGQAARFRMSRPVLIDVPDDVEGQADLQVLPGCSLLARKDPLPDAYGRGSSVPGPLC
jgi:hypothetical protein